jgi:hypothetical protein
MITSNTLVTSLIVISIKMDLGNSNEEVRISKNFNLVALVKNTNKRKGQTRTSGYSRGGVRCLEGVSISC